MTTTAAREAIPTRLDKHVRDCTGLSHREIKEAFRQGRIEVSSGILRLTDFVFAKDDVWLDDELLGFRRPDQYWMFHKPEGVITAVHDPYGRDCLAPWMGLFGGARVFPVGRLDKATSGLLLFFDDGDLAFAILHPSHHVEKQYRLHFDEPVLQDDPRLAMLLDGVNIGDGRPAAAVGLSWRSETSIDLRLNEGRYRQIRRMCSAARLRLAHLHRFSVGPIQMGVMEPGAVQRLSPADVDRLWVAVGGRQRIKDRRVMALIQYAQRRREHGTPHLRLEAWLRAGGDELLSSSST